MSTAQLNKQYRKLIVGLDKEVPVRGDMYVKYINFDNAATTPPFVSVVNSVIRFCPWYSSIHRGMGYKSMVSSRIYEEARAKVLKFVGAEEKSNTVIFVKNATEGLNKLSYRLIQDKNWVVLSTWMEHHSNDLPWRDKCIVDYVEIDEEGRLSLEDLEQKLRKYRGRVKLVTVTGASNVTGYINDIHKIATLAHKHGAKIIVDGAQLVPHVPIDMKSDNSEEHIDYLVFSAHKMYAPFGIGAIVGPKKSFEYGAPEYKGGGTVHVVTRKNIYWDDPPAKEEAGSPNIIGVVALVAAIEQLTKIGMDKIKKNEKLLMDYTLSKLKQLPFLKLYGCDDGCVERVGIIPFVVMGIPHIEIAKALSEDSGIGVRNGCFCAQPYIQRLLKLTDQEIKYYKKLPDDKKPGMVRVSFGLYNTPKEVDRLVSELRRIIKSN
ncbi:aminotransferase class V-fold PLP-dependent enzyme [Clostridium thermarum]|uniref:aminotransferase class V-fold PLP-dependent enzyme n=1 Tax=Clostridium thermarum TaxID=1716543 RepID=UPI0011236F6C|nr:aminotransferase class V-fold PLP-dependent enzyme [Clostridium thermarum]